LISGAWVAIAISGCQTVAPIQTPEPIPAPARSGQVAVEVVQPSPGTSRMKLPASQRFVFPNLIGPVPMPEYPRTLLAARLEPAVVCVEADIGADGRVLAARARADAGCAAEPVKEEFVRASTAAVRQWTFDPALLCVAPDATSDDPCLHLQVVERTTPVRLSYAFRFSQRDGSPLVEQVRGD
jgi:hypothetical protein